MTALALSALAEASTPYGIESFDSVLKPLWRGIKLHRGKGKSVDIHFGKLFLSQAHRELFQQYNSL